MAITILVEDGTGKPDANSYVSVAEFIQYASQYGTLLEDDDETAVLLMKAMRYLETKTFKGSRATLNQSLNWPRKDANIDCENPEVIYSETSVPANIKKAEMELALMVNDGVDLMPTMTAADYVIEETIGPITTKYADAASYGLSYAPSMPLVDSLLSCMIKSMGGQFRTVRATYG